MSGRTCSGCQQYSEAIPGPGWFHHRKDGTLCGRWLAEGESAEVEADPFAPGAPPVTTFGPTEEEERAASRPRRNRGRR